MPKALAIREKELLLSNQGSSGSGCQAGNPGMGPPRPLSAPTSLPSTPDLGSVVIRGAASSRGRCEGAAVLGCASGSTLSAWAWGGRGGADAEVAPA